VVTLAYWGQIADQVFGILLVLVGTTVLTFGISGSVTKWLAKGGDRNG